MDDQATIFHYKTHITHFDPQIFLREYHGFDSLAENGSLKCVLDALNDVFTGGMISGKRLLDVGTGPSFHTIIAACRHFEEIYLTDFAPQNLRILKEWWIGGVPHIEPAIKYCLGLENSSMTVFDKSTAIRLKVKGILSIDVTRSNPLAPNLIAPFDAIVSIFCLAGASTSREEYQEVVGNVATLLKKNGKLIIIDSFDETYFRVGNAKFGKVKLLESDIRQIYQDMGFQIEKYCFLPMKQDMRMDDVVSYFIMVVKKMID